MDHINAYDDNGILKYKTMIIDRGTGLKEFGI